MNLWRTLEFRKKEMMTFEMTLESLYCLGILFDELLIIFTFKITRVINVDNSSLDNRRIILKIEFPKDN